MTKLTKTQAAKAKMIREQLSKLRHWMEGYQMGSGKKVPTEQAIWMAQMFLDELLNESGAED